jgi:hypothetical protein
MGAAPLRRFVRWTGRETVVKSAPKGAAMLRLLVISISYAADFAAFQRERDACLTQMIPQDRAAIFCIMQPLA